jgi:8-oxo-dGTP pyrophosphatase MutT (NUDIX family)
MHPLDDIAPAFHDALGGHRDRLLAQAWCSPLQPRAALVTASGVPIGSVDPSLAAAMADAGLPLRRLAALPTPVAADGAADPALPRWGLADDRMAGGVSAAMDRLACWLNDHGHGGRWRDERLAVVDPAGRALGEVERAAVRVLGLTTFAVHLVGFARTGDGGVVQWVQQRAHDKATDPGLWDTLMGGQRGAGESLHDTLARETWEEAGLRIESLHGLRDAGRVTLRRPVRDGYLVEHVDLFEAVVPTGLEPANRDGEVERFEALDAVALEARLSQGLFTLEAGLMLVRATAPR